jgi:hypothetical protein
MAYAKPQKITLLHELSKSHTIAMVVPRFFQNLATVRQTAILTELLSLIFLVAERSVSFRAVLQHEIEVFSKKQTYLSSSIVSLVCQLSFLSGNTVENRCSIVGGELKKLASVGTEISLFPIIRSVVRKDGVEPHRSWLFEYLKAVCRTWAISDEVMNFLKDVAMFLLDDDILMLSAESAAYFIDKGSEQIVYVISRVEAFLKARPALRQQIMEYAQLTPARLAKVYPTWHVRFPGVFETVGDDEKGEETTEKEEERGEDLLAAEERPNRRERGGSASLHNSRT